MGIMATVRVNTSQKMVLYGPFIIQEADDGWMWEHEDGSQWDANGFCDSLFDCIDAIDRWYDHLYAREHDLTIPEEAS